MQKIITDECYLNKKIDMYSYIRVPLPESPIKGVTKQYHSEFFSVRNYSTIG